MPVNDWRCACTSLNRLSNAANYLLELRKYQQDVRKVIELMYF